MSENPPPPSDRSTSDHGGSPSAELPAGNEAVSPAASNASGDGENLLGKQIDIVSEPQLDKPLVETAQPRLLSNEMSGEWAPPARRVLLPLALFVLTCFTTFVAGCFHWQQLFLWSAGIEGGRILVQTYWQTGLIYMVCVMFALLCHEMGHFLMTIKHKVHASYPYFLPIPVTITGTLGAVIGMEHTKANRKELFDIGLAGPLAGLVPTMAFVVIGILVADHRQATVEAFGDPLIVQMLIPLLRPDLPADHSLIVNPFYMAGWVGMLVTGLNMLPVSQLDGGHVGYAVLGPHWGRTLARAFVLAVAGYFVVSGNYGWILMYLLVVMIGVDHPPTADDTVELGWFRRVLGLASLTIPIFCFTPVPLGQ